MNSIKEMWRDANTPLEYVVTLWVTGLAFLATTGWIALVFQLITNPESFGNATWGIFDTMG